MNTAFPCDVFDGKKHITSAGMTLRDYFAAKAMQSNLTVIREFPDENWRVGLALDAYATADAMLKARSKK